MEKCLKQEILVYLSLISKNIRKLRGDMTQAEFAGKVGVSRTTIHRIESRKNFNLESLLRIAITFGLYPYELCLTDEERNRLQFRNDVLLESFKEAIKKDIIANLKKG
jgi:DNA-binding XRE family transcriptional regulator